MPIKIYNTLTRKKEEFIPVNNGQIGMYVCGPTVYDVPHIGHARSAYAFDIIRRYFAYKGYEVKFVRNVTDIDDKIINKAKEEFKEKDLNIAVKSVSDKYLKVYHDYMEKLGILQPDAEPKATEYIDKMKGFIKILIERGKAYESGGDVYFDVRKAGNYGKLSNQSFEMLESGARVAPGENKKDPLDFALWKSSKEAEPSWPSDWGSGRPGWHIECSVMSSDILGDEFDIHGGGIDLVFPHHENEIAQSEGAGKKFARYWIHNGLLTINKEKMAKSLGNFITIEDILGKYPADVLKILFLQTHYSHPVDFSWEKMEEAKKAVERFYILFQKWANLSLISSGPNAGNMRGDIDIFSERFQKSMDDDFNTAEALAVLFEFVTYINKHFKFDKSQIVELTQAIESLMKLSKVFGLFSEEQAPTKKTEIAKEKIDNLIEQRNEARKKRDFKAADKIRQELDKIGIILEDTKDETIWRVK